MTKISLAAGAAIAALFIAAPAGAVTFTYTPGSTVAGVGFTPQTGYVIIEKFDNVSDLAGNSSIAAITGNHDEIHTAGSDGDGAQPFFSNPGNGYLSVLGPANDPGFANINFITPLATSFQFDWGSIDHYNTLTIHLVGGSNLVIIPGGNFTNTDANGNQTVPATNGVFTVKAGLGEKISGFTMESTQNSFEIDNLAVPGGAGTQSGTPEPATWAMMIAGFGMAGAMFRRRRGMVAT